MYMHEYIEALEVAEKLSTTDENIAAGEIRKLVGTKILKDIELRGGKLAD